MAEKLDLGDLNFDGLMSVETPKIPKKAEVQAEVKTDGLILKDEGRGISISIPLHSDEEIAEYERVEREIKNAELYEAYKNSGVPKKFLKESLDTFKVQNNNDALILATVKDFCKYPKNKILLLLGNKGTGKTHLGCGAVREIGGTFIMSEDLCVEYDSASDFNSKRTRAEVLKYYSSRKLLVIDELQKYAVNAKLEEWIISYLIRMRYENNLPTIIITNETKASFAKFIGSAVIDRLNECCISLEFTGESHRQKEIEF